MPLFQVRSEASLLHKKYVQYPEQNEIVAIKTITSKKKAKIKHSFEESFQRTGTFAISVFTNTCTKNAAVIHAGLMNHS